MEVLKLGTKNVRTCPTCGSELRYDEADVQVHHDPKKCMGPHEVDIEPEDYFDAYINCPVCKNGKRIYISATRAQKSAIIDRGKKSEHYF
jgi:hypothetical protein